MNRTLAHGSIARLLLILAAFLGISVATGCEETITLENYERITEGMDLIEVEDILGGPGELQQASGVSISSGGMLQGESGEGDTKDYLWGDENEGIVVKFRDGKVYHKTKRGL